MLNPRQSLAQSVGVEVNENVAPFVEKSRMYAMPEGDDSWDFKGTVGLDEVEHVGVKQRFRDLPDYCRV